MTAPGDAQATPEMVEQLGGLDEVELTKDGVRPLSPQAQAESSPQASQDGAAAEPAGPAPEAQPAQAAPTSTTQPAQQVVEQAPQPVVTVDPAVTATPAPVAPVPAVVEPEAKPDEEAAALTRLDEFVKGEVQEASEEARRTAQSVADKRSAQVDRQIQGAGEQITGLTKQLREMELRDLTEVEREKALEVYAQKDERDTLIAMKADVLDLARGTQVDSLMLEYEQYGVTRGEVEAIEAPEEMELYCEHQKSEFLERKLAEGPKPEATVAPQPAPAPAPVETKPEETAPPPQPNAPGVPAGATSPSDVGTGGQVDEGKKFSEDQGSGAMQDNLRNMGWSRVQVRQG